MIKVLAKAVLVMDMVKRMQPVGFKVLLRESKWNKSTLSVILKSMVELGLLERNDREEFVAGAKLREFGAPPDFEARLSSLCEKHVRPFAGRLNELVTVAVVSGMTRRLVARYQSERSVRMDEAPDFAAQWSSTATGRLLLAHLPDEERDRVARTHNMEERAAALRGELAKIVRDSVCVVTTNDGEGLLMSVPIRHGGKAAAAALGVSIPAYRLGEGGREALLEKLRVLALRLEKELAREQ